MSTGKTILIVVLVLLGLSTLKTIINQNNTVNAGLTDEQRKTAQTQVAVESCVDEADKPTWTAKVTPRQYCTCVVNKVVDKVGIEGLAKYDNDDTAQIVEDFYPEIKACLTPTKEA